jgi:hypothetical protein
MSFLQNDALPVEINNSPPVFNKGELRGGHPHLFDTISIISQNLTDSEEI